MTNLLLCARASDAPLALVHGMQWFEARSFVMSIETLESIVRREIQVRRRSLIYLAALLFVIATVVAALVAM
jgi:hypothetical protein